MIAPLPSSHPFGSGQPPAGLDAWIQGEPPDPNEDDGPPYVELKCHGCHRYYEVHREDLESLEDGAWEHHYCSYECAKREHNPND